MRAARVVLTLIAVLIVGVAGFAYFGTDEATDTAWDTVTRPFLGPPPVEPWTAPERRLLAEMSLQKLGAPRDPTNRYLADPRAAKLGHHLFFDTRFSATGGVSCATCHQPERGFTDGLGRGAGIGFSKRNTRSLLGAAHSTWQYWDGRRDSLWAQALTPVEDPNEHGFARTGMVVRFAAEPGYRDAWQEIVGQALPDLSDEARFPLAASPLGDEHARAAWQAMARSDRAIVNGVFASLGKFIAAYETLLQPGSDPLEDYIASVADGNDGPVDGFGLEAIAGLKLFIGKARCLECHNGPLLTNNEFHNTGVLSAPGELPDRGRVDGVRLAAADPFNCLSAFSDDHTCAELRYRRTGITVIGATRTPALRGVVATAPYMHQGQIGSLAEVVDHYDLAEESMIGHNEAKPLELTPRESRHLVTFLESLLFSAAADAAWLAPPEPLQAGAGAPVVVTGAWARATPPGSRTAAVYFSITNTGTSSVVISDFDSDVGAGMLHHTVESDGMARMHHMDSVEIAAGATVELEPGGVHVMLMGLSKALVAGETFGVQLYPAEGEPIEIQVQVRELTWLPDA